LLSRLVGGTALVLLLAGAGVYLAVARSLTGAFDRNLSDRIQSLASLLFQQGDHVEFEFSDQLMPEYERAQSPAYFELRFEDGTLLERSASLAGAELVVPRELGVATIHWTAALPDGHTGRYAAREVEVHHVYPEEGPNRPQARRVRIVVARGRAELVRAELAVLLQCVAASLAVIAGIAVLSWRTVTRGLEPTRRLAATLDAIRVERLPERLETGELPRELEPVARKTEELVRRLGAALERERRTTADIAHELRTPISELITVSEVALRNGHDALSTRYALGTMRDVAWNMGRSVSTLLKLARLEMGAETFERRPVDLQRLVAEVLRSLAHVERERRLVLETDLPPSACVEGDEDALRIVAANLLSNALYEAPEGSRVSCALELDANGWSLAVENDAPHMAPGDLGSLSEPFWRKDRARTQRDRSGLGLALSRALAEATDMELHFVLERQRFRAELRAARKGDRERPRGAVAWTASPSGARDAS
jgi:signal transduction histidine kinase